MSRNPHVLVGLPSYACQQCIRWVSRQHRPWRTLHSSPRRAQDPRSILAVLEERGYINQIAGDRTTLDRLLRTRKLGFYAGIDPTAPSLHLGHLLPLMVLFWLYHDGHNVVSLVGGATARVGDPSGRLTSRANTAELVHESNFKAMHAQLGGIWDNAVQYGRRHGYGGEASGTRELLNNATWLDSLNILDFLKTMGHGMRLGAMLGRDTVRNKLEKGDGMSFSELTYPLLQAWDWWHMYQSNGVQVQIGGSDQYGNIIAGMDAVKYIAQNNVNRPERWLDTAGKLKEDAMPMGLTVPLLTTASGEKFGKSAGNAVWLDRKMTSAFDLYGFLLRSPDEDVERYLKLFTFLPLSQISSVMGKHTSEPGKRKAQHLLASEVLELVHGRDEAKKTREEHQALRSPSLGSMFARGNGTIAIDAQSDTHTSSATQRSVLPSSLVLNTPFSRILYHAGIVSTKSEGARLIAKGGAYVAAPSLVTSAAELDDSSKLEFVQMRDQKPGDVQAYVMSGMLVLRLGKWKVRVVDIVEDDDYDAQGLDAPGWQEWKAVQLSK